MTDDLTWLAPRVGRNRVHRGGVSDEQFASLIDVARAGHIVEPTGVTAQAAKHDTSTGGGTGGVIALIGWPTGRHHSLIKAAEARLAVDEGATEVWLSVDDALVSSVKGLNAVLADIIAVRQVVDSRARLGVTCPAAVGVDAITQLDAVAQHGGVDLLAVELGDSSDSSEPPALNGLACESAFYGTIPTLDAALDLLLAGAARVFV
ncbi:hypothetical protein KBX18_00045 [Corynebacterium sp. CCUG 69979]|uniref:hypothetical protein n=1 Tax=Corynebacterium sp. CCUG 69979 TaxID=2823890 RepID=UPI0021098770|nr:hypothetical protein [Corynebacterium sp. CCUG 69979]MCQ4623959.1 hypothetical protein [Corynebacterium sp. CCUG 69979]